MAIFEGAVTVYPKIVSERVGIKEAIVLATIHYWQQYNRKKGQSYVQGRYWTYNSIREWAENYFTAWSRSTVRRVFNRLRDLGLLITGRFNKLSFDRKLWYSINHEKCTELFGYDPFIDDTDAEVKPEPEQVTDGSICKKEQIDLSRMEQTIAQSTPHNTKDDFESTLEKVKQQYGVNRCNQALAVLNVYTEKTRKPVSDTVALLKDIAIHISRYAWMLDKSRESAPKNKRQAQVQANTADDRKKALIRSLYLS